MHVWNGQSQVSIDTGIDLSAGYHTYGMEYRPGQSIKMYLDGVLMNTWTSNIATGPYEIIMGVQMAHNASGWHTVIDTSNYPGPFEMDISDVQVYHL